ncbi:MAG TPA: oligosaccharide flippase family protein [Actinomycetota bacterium]|nr:oligosaccharide flippase family protein [Actinomycetota bacterium]
MEAVAGGITMSATPEGAEARPGSPVSSSDVKTVAKGGAVQIFGQVSQRGLSFLFNAIALRFIGRSLFGVYRQMVQILAIASQIGLAGFNFAAMRFITLARAQGDPGGVKGAARVAIVATTVASLLVAAAVVIGAEPIAGVFADNEAQVPLFVELLRIGAIYAPLFALLQVLRYCTQAYKTMVPSVIAGNVIQPAARFVIGVIVLLLGFEVGGLLTTLNVSVAIAAVAAAIYFARMMSQEERSAPAHAPVGAMVKFAIPQGGSSLLGVQTLGAGVLIVGAFSSNAQAGLFAVALMLQGPGTVFLGGILNIWAPVVSDLHAKGEIERLESMYQTITRWIATFSFPVWAALIIAPHVFVQLFGGRAGAGAAPIVVMLAVGNIFYTGTGPTGYVLSMTGRPWVNLANSVVAVALYVGIGAFVVPRYDAFGMAVVDASVTAVVNSVRVIEAKILVGVQPFGRSILKPIGATLVGAAVLLLWMQIPGRSAVVDGAGIAVAGLVYVGVLRLMGLDEEERIVWRSIRRRVSRGRS